MPTLCAPGLARVTDRPLAGAVLWRIDLRDDGAHLILPDLSPDLVWTDRLPIPVPRTTTRMTLPAVRGTGAIGLRLPIAAADVRIDRNWPGWTVDDPNDGEERVARLSRAVTEGAVTWRIIDERADMIRMLNRPGTRIPQVAAELWMSERTLRRTCRAWFGTSPGALAQVLRLWRFARATQRLPLAGAADEAGYADQPHANRDIRAITGLRGRELAAWSASACGLDPPTPPS